MSGETTCPTCGSLVESKVVYDSFLPDGIINSGHRARVEYRTTADPARVARLEGLLREIEWGGHTYYRGDNCPACGWCGARKDMGHALGCKLAALLGPAE